MDQEQRKRVGSETDMVRLYSRHSKKSWERGRTLKEKTQVQQRGRARRGLGGRDQEIQERENRRDNARKNQRSKGVRLVRRQGVVLPLEGGKNTGGEKKRLTSYKEGRNSGRARRRMVN